MAFRPRTIGGHPCRVRRQPTLAHNLKLDTDVSLGILCLRVFLGLAERPTCPVVSSDGQETKQTRFKCRCTRAIAFA